MNQFNDPEGCIYFFQVQPDGPIKIGWTYWRVRERLNSARTHNPSPIELVALVVATKDREAVLHRRFAADHIKGEWFRPSEAILAFIRDEAGPCPTEEDNYIPAEVLDYWSDHLAGLDVGEPPPCRIPAETVAPETPRRSSRLTPIKAPPTPVSPEIMVRFRGGPHDGHEEHVPREMTQGIYRDGICYGPAAGPPSHYRPIGKWDAYRKKAAKVEVFYRGPARRR